MLHLDILNNPQDQIRIATLAELITGTTAVAGYIYVLKADLKIGGSSVVKIGMTTRSVAKRIRELSTGSPVELNLIYVLPVVNPAAVERYLHGLFAAYRANSGGSEYFRIDPRLVVRELDRIATEVSKERAREARDSELRKFKDQIGAGALERQIGKISERVPVAVLGGCLAVGMWKYGWTVIFSPLLLAPLFFAAFAAIHFGLKWLLTTLWLKPRFGARIAARWEELRSRFPLAYQKADHIPAGARIGTLPEPARRTVSILQDLRPVALQSLMPLLFLAGVVLLLLVSTSRLARF